jgi:hypothetical protein
VLRSAGGKSQSLSSLFCTTKSCPAKTCVRQLDVLSCVGVFRNDRPPYLSTVAREIVSSQSSPTSSKISVNYR